MDKRYNKEEETKNIAIKIALAKEDEHIAKEIFYGIEEEGIPYTLEYTKENEITLENINRYAYREARKSKLSLGIAICKRKAVFHFSKLEEKQPLFVLNNLQDSEKDEKRIYGSNLARVVKGIPLKEMKNS